MAGYICSFGEFGAHVSVQYKGEESLQTYVHIFTSKSLHCFPYLVEQRRKITGSRRKKPAERDSRLGSHLRPYSYSSIYFLLEIICCLIFNKL